MNETSPQPNQERNLALERQEAVKLHNEVLKEQENLPGTEKIENPDKVNEMSALREKVGDIDKYRGLAKPFDDRYYYRVGDISTVEKLNQEKTKIDKEIGKVKLEIEDTVNQLNELRKKLGMEPSNDIPSLDIKKERLPYLLDIQKDLESKLNLESKKVETLKGENFENKQRESKNFDEIIKSISYDIGNFSKSLEERQSNGYNKIFQNQEVFRTLASSNPDFSNFEEIKNYFSSIKNATEIENVMDMNEKEDNPESMYNASRLLKQLSVNIQEFISKIQDENQKKEINGTVSTIIENLDRASSFISRKAQAIEMYKNVKLP